MATAKISDFTAEQWALVDQVHDEYLREGLRTRSGAIETIAVEKFLSLAYGSLDLQVPGDVRIVSSPKAALDIATEKTGTQQYGLDWYSVGRSAWYSRYDFAHRIGEISDEDILDLHVIRDFSRTAWDCVLLDDCAIIVEKPIALRTDDAGNLHGAGAPCVEWADGEKDFAWHGQWVPERVVMDPRSYTRDEYLAINNTELRRALSESGGWSWVAELLGASSVDSWTDPQTSLGYTLLKCPDGQTLLAQQSPPLKDGSQPKYLEPVHEDLRTARAARKWQATTLTPAQCEADPSLSYGVET